MNSTQQQTFDFSPWEQPEVVSKFQKFHESHPEVYDEIKRRCHAILNKTKRKIGFRMIYEVARYEVFFVEDREEKYKMNNNYCPAYLRMFLRDFPMYDGRIEKRTSIFDNYIK